MNNTATAHTHTVEAIEITVSNPLENIGELTGVDQDASIERYGDMLTDALQREYPSATVTVRIERSYGAAGRTIVLCGDPECYDTDALKSDVEDTASAVWQDMEGGWIVLAEES